MIGLLGGIVGWVVGGKVMEVIEKECEKRGAHWAPDPYERAVLRWWDGTKWTKDTLNSGPRVNEYLAYQRGKQEGTLWWSQ
jgi:hypothetical protein